MSTADSGPIWTQPAPGSRKPRFTRDQIAEVAIRIADREGFEALSMRRIADELGAGTMTIYHYVRTKQDLISLIDDALTAEVLVPPEQLTRDWVASLAAIGRASYGILRRHPWALSALSGATFGPNGMRHLEQSFVAVAHAPFDLRSRFDAISIVDEYVFGHFHRNAEIGRHTEFSGAGAPSPALLGFVREQLATGEYPMFSAMIGDDLAGALRGFARQMNDADRFERGLIAVLEGLRRTLGRGGRRRTPKGSLKRDRARDSGRTQRATQRKQSRQRLGRGRRTARG